MNSQNNWKAREINETAANITRRAFEAGVKIAAGSEAGTPFDPHNGYAAEVLLMNSELAMPSRDALHAAGAVAGPLQTPIMDRPRCDSRQHNGITP